MTQFATLISAISPCKLEEPLHKHTSFKVGGPAEIFALPGTINELLDIISTCNKHSVPLTIIGGGSNMLIADTGLRGVVVNLKHLNQMSHHGDGKLEAQAGVNLKNFAVFAYKHGYTGLEFASGIPGTLGGAIYMNAGAYGSEVGDVCTHVTVYDGTVRTISKHDMHFGYRNSIVQGTGAIVLSATFQMPYGGETSQFEIKMKMRELNTKRRISQPLQYPSAGSTFKRPLGHFAGKLIEDAGLKGHSIGGAMVSTKHAGFIVNTGSATAKDIYDLIQDVRQRVHMQFDVMLEPEVKILGF